ncbi:hypothetical protein CN425_24215 [Bacillus cereus]|uniref:Group-specific protein n=1 Tax=Bacillus cereus TaxID=1396 RepID=A0A2A8PQH1_BACCE|nr:hypothetical protein [Bacillus cereus]EJS66552.1 hypothetical protein ICU_03614 [Bacillus cereus BAG2X1-1]PEA10046.1 hypothetical protein CON38_09190 [Bacillus cereus]PEV97476.1 hypothetical protein CN425_24215 [Bacillus cereus]PFI24954.1 hypothetical protein COI75_07545 [Bacillus cereus]
MQKFLIFVAVVFGLITLRDAAADSDDKVNTASSMGKEETIVEGSTKTEDTTNLGISTQNESQSSSSSSDTSNAVSTESSSTEETPEERTALEKYYEIMNTYIDATGGQVINIERPENDFNNFLVTVNESFYGTTEDVKMLLLNTTKDLLRQILRDSDMASRTTGYSITIQDEYGREVTTGYDRPQ